MRSWTSISIGILLLPPLGAQAQVINGQSTYESNLQNRPPVELEDSTLMPKPQPRRDDAGSERESDRSVYPSR